MSDIPNDNPLAQHPKFKRVSRSFNTAGGSRRGKAKLAVTRSGRCRTNADGKEAFIKFIREQGGDPNNFSITFGGNEEQGTMAIYSPKASDPGAMQVGQTKNALTFHCGACFDENPLLRPSGKIDCGFAQGFDADGEPCLIVNISGGMPSRTVKRPPKENKPEEKKA